MLKKAVLMVMCATILMVSVQHASATAMDEDLSVKYSNNTLKVLDSRQDILETADVFPVTSGYDLVGKGRINAVSFSESEFSGRLYLKFFQGKSKIACFLIGASEAKRVMSLLTGECPKEGIVVRTTNCNLS